MRFRALFTLFIAAIANAATPPARPDQLGPTWTSGIYTYDGAGNVSAVGTNAYTYDAMSRLNGPYQYDAYGNRTQYAVDANNRRSGQGIRYDDAGNLMESGGENYSYDACGMMVGKEHGSPTWYDRYLYTADDQRIGVRVGDTWTWTFRDASQNVARRYQSSYSNPAAGWTWSEDYVYGTRGMVAAKRSDGLRHFHVDHLGTPRLITGNTGASIAQHEYSPFGVESPSSQSEEIKKFTGHERDLVPDGQPNPDRYLDYMHARYYDPHEGRFLSADPKLDYERASHDPQRWNRYAYVANNPMNRTDPTGEILTILSGYNTIQQIAGAAASRVCLNDDGTLDVSGLTVEDLVSNEGALLLYEMARSEKAYTYKEGKTADTMAGPQPVDGMTNLDQQSMATATVAKHFKDFPVGEVDGAVTVDPTQHWFDADTGTRSIPIAAVAFHELAESYAKVEMTQPRGPHDGPWGGHWEARQRETTLMDQRRWWTQYPAGGKVARHP